MSIIKKVTTYYGKWVKVVYLPPNQAYAVMWCDQVLRVYNSRQDAHAEANRITRP